MERDILWVMAGVVCCLVFAALIRAILWMNKPDKISISVWMTSWPETTNPGVYRLVGLFALVGFCAVLVCGVTVLLSWMPNEMRTLRWMIGLGFGLWLALNIGKLTTDGTKARLHLLSGMEARYEAKARMYADIVKVAGSKNRLVGLKREFEQEASRLNGINKEAFKIEIDACKEGAEAIQNLLLERIYAKSNNI
jgi:hypothetical protein